MSLNDSDFLSLLRYLHDNPVGSTESDTVLDILLQDGRDWYTLQADDIPKIRSIRRKFKYLHKYASAIEKRCRLEHMITKAKTEHSPFNEKIIRELETALFGDVPDMLVLLNVHDESIKQIAAWRLRENI